MMKTVFVWVSIGPGYQILVYGPDSWTSMTAAGHILGWPVFFIVWGMRGFFWAFIGLLVVAILMLAGAWVYDKINLRRRQKALLARRGVRS
jgi:hypothetical protein